MWGNSLLRTALPMQHNRAESPPTLVPSALAGEGSGGGVGWSSPITLLPRQATYATTLYPEHRSATPTNRTCSAGPHASIIWPVTYPSPNGKGARCDTQSRLLFSVSCCRPAPPDNSQ